MMDYEGIVRASGRTHAPRGGAPGAMGVVPVASPRQQQTAAAPQQRQQQGQQAPRSPAPQPQFLGGACYPTTMGMQ